MVSTVLAALRTAVIVPTFFLFTLALAGLVSVVAMFRPDTPFIESVIRFWSRFFLRAAGTKLTVHGAERIAADGQYVFVANHLSNLDIPAMFLTAPVPIRYLAKKEVYKIPLVATAMRRIGIVRVDRERGSAIHAEVNAGVAAAKARGHSLIIFPEGTRSVDGEPQTFKKGAFRIAIANDLPVVPITIAGTWEVWPPGAKMWRPGPVGSIVHDPIPTNDLELGDIDRLRDQVAEVISSTYRSQRAT